MGWWTDLLNWTSAPSPSQPMVQVERWARPVSFTLNVPSEFTEGGTGSGVPRVSRELAVSVPAVKRGRDLICGTLGTLRLKKHDAGRRIVPSELLDQPEEDIARSVTMTATVDDMLFEGRSWWRILEFGPDGFPSKVRRLEPRSVNVRRDGRVYVNRGTGQAQGMAQEWLQDAELIRIDSPNDPLLTAAAAAIRAAHRLERAAGRYADEPLPLGYFTPRDGVDVGTPDEIEEMLDEWEDARSRRVWGYVGAGLDPHTVQWSPEQLQLGEARDYAVLEIARAIGVDPEELGVSTTSRTYANAEQRRLDMVDFTLAAYVTAIEDRLSMPDVTPPGYYVRADYAGFLRSDTLTRMQTYEIGRRVGVYNDQRIAEIEDIPTARPPAPPISAAGASPPAAAPPADQGAASVDSTSHITAANSALNFAAGEPELVIGFSLPPGDAAFAVDAPARRITGTVIPWNTPAFSRGYIWMFAPGSLHWASESRVKLDRDHRPGSEFGRAVTLTNGPSGLSGAFSVARGPDGDQMLSLADDGVYDGLSASVTFEAEADGWTAHPDNPAIRLVHSGTLRKVALTAMPAFDDARVASVAARREEGSTMTAPAAPAPSTPPPAAPPVPAATPAPDFAAFTAGLTDAIRTSVEEAFARLPQPQDRQVIPAGRAVVQREAPVYLMNGHGPSLVRDSWKARTEGDHEAAERLRKFSRQTQDVAEQAMHPEFQVTTGNASQIVPPGYRPDLYVTQLMQGRPLVDNVSRGTLSDATPFNIPAFVSATNSAGTPGSLPTSTHVEGTNPLGGTLTLGTVTVTPGAISGLFELTREIVDSANPAVDAIAMAAMQESYAQQTEALVYGQLNGATGQGGTITNGFVPSGAQAALISGGDGEGGSGTPDGADLVGGVRRQLALYPFRRFNAPNRAHLSSAATSLLAGAVGSDGRPLLPSVGAQNTAGLGNAVQQGWFIDGLAFQPTWSMTGAATTDAAVMIFNSADVWAWESPLLMFRFEERNGPARIDLALFGYFATRILRPVGLSSLRFDPAAVA